jgi:hypothetical protein
MSHIRTSFRLISVSILTTFIVISIGAGQLLGPRYFSTIGRQQSAVLPFLRAAVKLGDVYLMKEIFPDTLMRQYPVVLDSYIQEEDLQKRLEKIELRAPMSLDVLSALSVLYGRSGNTVKEAEYQQKVKELDPAYVEDNLFY